MKNRVAVLHGVNLGALDRRPAEHYGGLTFSRLERRIDVFARELGLEARFFHTNHEGEYVEEMHKASDYADGLLLNPGRVDALRVVAARRARAVRAAGRRGAPVGRACSARPFRRVSVLEGMCVGHGQRQGRRGLPRRAGGAEGGAVSRADRVADVLDERGLDLLLVTDLVNLRYLTGFTGSNGMAVVGRDVRRFVTDFRYVEQAAEQVPDFDREPAPQDFVTALGDGWPDGELRLGFEDDHVSRPPPRPAARAWCRTGSSWCRPAGSSNRCGRSRTPARSSAIRAAAALADAVYGMLREQGLVGRTEREVALALENEMRRLGAEEPSFSSIVASAERGALPHAVPTDVRDPARHARDARHRRAAGRLLLRLHAHVGDRRAAGRPGRGLRARPARAAGGARRGAAGPGGPRGRRGRAADHRGGGPRRALRPRARPRRGARGPRGAAARAHRRRRRWWRATS